MRSRTSPRRPNTFRDISFSVRKGEVFGIAGLDGCRADRAGARHHRRRSDLRRRGPAARQAGHAALADRRDPQRHRAGAGRPQAAGRGARPFDRGEHRLRQSRRNRRRNGWIIVAPPPPVRRRLHPEVRRQGARPPECRRTVRRQPAEGGAGQVAGAQAAGRRAGRADARHRRRRALVDLRPDHGSRARGASP